MTATVRLTKAGTARMTLVDLGIPPGFTVQTEDLDAAVKVENHRAVRIDRTPNHHLPRRVHFAKADHVGVPLESAFPAARADAQFDDVRLLQSKHRVHASADDTDGQVER